MNQEEVSAMPWGIYIPAEEQLPIEYRQFGSLSDYNEAVGDYFQTVDLVSPEATFFVNEEGKLLDLPLNRRATLLLWVHNPAFRRADVLNGNAVLIGWPDDNGDTLDVPAELVTLLLKTETYAYEVQTVEDEDKWYGNQARYDNWVDAYNAALGLLGRWILASDVRVIAA